jgi:hypothetical protein
MTTLETVLQYAERGWAVFPLKPRGKTPISANATYLHATSDPVKIRAWWELQPDANVAIQPARSGMVVLDIDPKNGGLESLEALVREHGGFATLTATTGSGGKHYYFILPEGLSGNKLGIRPGVDLIVDKNHVVAPPSVHPSGGLYRWDNDTVKVAELPLWLCELARPRVAAPVLQLVTADNGLKGRLSKKTLDFLKSGAPQGEWNNRIYLAAKDSQEQGYSQDWFIAEATKVTGHLTFEDYKTIKSAYNEAPKYPPRLDSNELVKRLIQRCHRFTNIEDLKDVRFVDISTGAVHNIDEKLVNILLDEDERKDFRAQCYLAKFTYDPRMLGPIDVCKRDSIILHNIYNPPAWLAPHFFRKAQLPAVGALPAIYRDFFTHLTAGDEPSFEYLLDWMARSLKERNHTILTAIGEQGIGKGILAMILNELHGESNFSFTTDVIFKEKFNAQMLNKTLVYVDEVDIKTKESHDRVKAVVNDVIQVEAKGVDATAVKNYANFYITSNSLDAIRIEAGDRRYSVIQLTDTPLRNTQLIGIVGQLIDPVNVGELALYLLERKCFSNKLEPFRSKRFEEIREELSTDWELYVIDHFCTKYAGTTQRFSFLKKEVEDRLSDLGLKHAPGRRKFVALAKRYPEWLRIRGKAQDMVEIGPFPALAATPPPKTVD